MSAIPRIKRSKYDRSTTGRGLSLTPHTLNFIPASMKVRMLRDQILLEPMDVVYSRHLIVTQNHKPLRGRVLAIGPGHYRKIYDHPDKHRRSKMWDSKHFTPCDVKVGDVVELGGAEIGGYAFETLWYGDKRVLICSERDVAGVVSDD